VVGEIDRLRRLAVGLSWCELAEGRVRPAGVVMQQVLGQHLPQVVLIDDQQPVEDPGRCGGAQGRSRHHEVSALAQQEGSIPGAGALVINGYVAGGGEQRESYSRCTFHDSGYVQCGPALHVG
jgi:hypothetical protein